MAEGIYKVIPSGVTECDMLRATLMLSPSVPEADLKKLPSLLLEQWRRRQWTMQLRVVKLWITGDPCASSLDQAQWNPIECAGDAFSGIEAWGSRGDVGWVDDLWAASVARSEDATHDWTELFNLLKASNCGSGLQPGSELCKSPPAASAEAAAAASAAASAASATSATPPAPATQDAGTTHVQTIVPSRQSDLALLLESERALEICATARWARGDYVSCHAEEEGCRLRLEQGSMKPPTGGTDTDASKAYVDPTDAKQAELRKAATDRFDQAKNSLSSLYECKPLVVAPEIAPAPWLLAPSTMVGGRETIADELPAATRSHREANQVEVDDAATRKSSVVAQSYFAIQGSPALSRLFGLTVDLEIDPKNLNEKLGLTKEQVANEATVVLLLLGTNAGDAGLKPVFTLTRYRPARHKHFMPASRLELQWDDKTSFHPQASQHEGVLILGQKLAAAGDQKTPVNRFVLSSLDVPRATNGAIDRIGMPPTKEPNSHKLAVEEALNKNKSTEMVGPASKEPLLARKPTGWARKTHSTAGLVLLDRGRAEQALQQFASRSVHEQRGSYLLLDSNDLLVGYRLDVGVPVGKACDFAWRSLMARDIQHGYGGPHADNVSKKVRLLLGGSSGSASIWQRTLDDAQLSLPARLVKAASKPNEPNSKDAYVEEVVAVWTGEPMAALCAADEKLKENDASIGAGELITLPHFEPNSDRVPPPLRFGWPYRLGVRAVYAGGISLPLTHAKRLYDDESACTTTNALALPAREKDKASGIRRYLRHERIAAPFLLMHKDIAMRGTKLGYERSAHAIVRSTVGQASPEYGEPKETRRIFIPSSVEMHFAAMHGVFDEMEQPAQGLTHMRFDAKNGGFPYVTAKSVEGINGENFYGPRSIQNEGDERGDAVYIEQEAKRPHPYFPDPAALVWVVAVRHAGTNAYLDIDHGPVTIPVRKTFAAYPDCTPLVLRIVRATSPRSGGVLPTLQQVVSVAPGISGHARGGVEVVVKLAPGEDFEVDVWCTPDANALADFMAPVESIGALALLHATSGDPSAQPELKDYLVVALKKMLPAEMVDSVLKKMKECGCWPPSEHLQKVPLNDGLGGLGAPGGAFRKAIAAALYETLCIRPIDEVAAVQSLRVTHVTAQPVRQPAFEPVQSDRRLGTRRTLQGLGSTAATHDAVAALAAPPAASSASAPSSGSGTPAGTANVPKEASTPDLVEYFLTGDVRVDLNTTGAIEFRALATCPTTSAFDDPRRGRTARDKRNAAWPTSGQSALSTEAVFGFDVCNDGKVTLPMREISLVQIENLEQPTPNLPAAYRDGMWRLNMEHLTAGQSCSIWGRVASRHVFPDRKARRLRVRMFARTRHEEFMRTGSGIARLHEWLQPGEEPRGAKEPGLDSAIEIWLPAGIRPSEPIAKTPIPAFDWEKLGTTVNRKVVVRVPLGRGWFSSGEGERLGIIVWPPGTLDSVAQVPLRGPIVPPKRQAPLPNFVDEDLGPGGKFVTRWGSDPTRPIDSEARSDPKLPGFLEPSAFKDVSGTSRSGFNVELVSQARMPVRRDATADATEDDAKDTPLTMEVSLVTYEPLFDIETEQWYVEIALEHAFEAQPFVRLGLVRYQPNAPEDLQVSFPTTQWVQMLPERNAWMITEDQGKEKSTWLSVEGLGPADASTDAGNKFVGTRMRARVVTEYRSAAGLLCRHVGPPLDMQAERQNSGRSPGAPYRGPRWLWTRQIDVDALDDENKESPDATHYVYVEEREAYLPATYAKEPVSAAVAAGELDACDHVESGPRFAVRLPLRRPKPLKK